MRFSNFNNLKFLYVELLPIFDPMQVFLGFCSGLGALRNCENPFDLFTNVIGHTTIGIITGLMYPVTYPLLGGYVLYKNFKQIILK